MIRREPEYYVTGYNEPDASRAPFYLRALVFDGEQGDFNAGLIEEFNLMMGRQEKMRARGLKNEYAAGKAPSKIVIINASHDNLPASYETARVFREYLKTGGHAASVKVVNTREGLLAELEDDAAGVLLMSQCVDKNVYNTRLAEELEKKGVVIVPGKSTAPGGIFSDKDSTYKLLSDNGKKWDEVARYRKIEVQGRTVTQVVDGIFSAVEELREETRTGTFFVKPNEGGGGLGGFRITKRDEGYLIPDLSKVSGDVAEIHPTFIDFDTDDHAKIRELLWIYRLFASDEKMTANYLKVRLPVEDKSETEAVNVVKEYLKGCEHKRTRRLESMSLSRETAKQRLVKAIRAFEDKFNRRYIPLVNEHIDFGLWGLRAHLRLSRGGPVLEAMYHRVFQLGFTEEGVGYLGADNISNKQTGDLEIIRLGPVNPVMVESIGGKTALFDTLIKGVNALLSLDTLLPVEEKGRVPLRLQLDLAAVSRRIGEGNADTARGLCLASRWGVFAANTAEWLEDSLAYYAWKKTHEEAAGNKNNSAG
ncbi:MAG: hypothetical protein ABH883_07320 [Candidatus Omnitrophota bacterium]